MASETKDWFIGERSEALATVLLRSRNDIQVRDESSADGGADFLVDVSQGDSRWSMLFVVQVKGTISSDYKAWFQGAKQLFIPDERSRPVLPTCLFLFNVRDSKACFAWIAEPLVLPDKSATLRFAVPEDFLELDQSAINEIIGRVRTWYATGSGQLTPKEA